MPIQYLNELLQAHYAKKLARTTLFKSSNKTLFTRYLEQTLPAVIDINNILKDVETVWQPHLQDSDLELLAEFFCEHHALLLNLPVDLQQKLYELMAKEFANRLCLKVHFMENKLAFIESLIEILPTHKLTELADTQQQLVIFVDPVTYHPDSQTNYTAYFQINLLLCEFLDSTARNHFIENTIFNLLPALSSKSFLIALTCMTKLAKHFTEKQITELLKLFVNTTKIKIDNHKINMQLIDFFNQIPGYRDENNKPIMLQERIIKRLAGFIQVCAAEEYIEKLIQLLRHLKDNISGEHINCFVNEFIAQKNYGALAKLDSLLNADQRAAIVGTYIGCTDYFLPHNLDTNLQSIKAFKSSFNKAKLSEIIVTYLNENIATDLVLKKFTLLLPVLADDLVTIVMNYFITHTLKLNQAACEKLIDHISYVPAALLADALNAIFITAKTHCLNSAITKKLIHLKPYVKSCTPWEEYIDVLLAKNDKQVFGVIYLFSLCIEIIPESRSHAVIERLCSNLAEAAAPDVALAALSRFERISNPHSQLLIINALNKHLITKPVITPGNFEAHFASIRVIGNNITSPLLRTTLLPTLHALLLRAHKANSLQSYIQAVYQVIIDLHGKENAVVAINEDNTEKNVLAAMAFEDLKISDRAENALALLFKIHNTSTAANKVLLTQVVLTDSIYETETTALILQKFLKKNLNQIITYQTLDERKKICNWLREKLVEPAKADKHAIFASYLSSYLPFVDTPLRFELIAIWPESEAIARQKLFISALVAHKAEVALRNEPALAELDADSIQSIANYRMAL